MSLVSGISEEQLCSFCSIIVITVMDCRGFIVGTQGLQQRGLMLNWSHSSAYVFQAIQFWYLDTKNVTGFVLTYSAILQIWKWVVNISRILNILKVIQTSLTLSYKMQLLNANLSRTWVWCISYFLL